MKAARERDPRPASQLPRNNLPGMTHDGRGWKARNVLEGDRAGIGETIDETAQSRSEDDGRDGSLRTEHRGDARRRTRGRFGAVCRPAHHALARNTAMSRPTSAI